MNHRDLGLRGAVHFESLANSDSYEYRYQAQTSAGHYVGDTGKHAYSQT